MITTFKNGLRNFKERIKDTCYRITKQNGTLIYRVKDLSTNIHKAIDDVWPKEFEKPIIKHLQPFPFLSHNDIIIKSEYINELTIDDYYLYGYRYVDKMPFGAMDGILILKKYFESNECYLICGTAGSGKTTYIKTLLNRMSMLKNYKKEIYICDPKMVEYDSYKNDPRFKKVVEDKDSILKTVKSIRDKCMKRYKMLKNNPYKKNIRYSNPKIVLVIDELADFPATYKNKIIGYLNTIARHNKSTGITFIVSTQNYLSCFNKKQLDKEKMTRIVFATSTIEESKAALGYIDASELTNKGEAYIVGPDYYYLDEDYDLVSIKVR